MSRLPIRLRVTAAFAGVMAVLLAGLGLFIYLRYQAQVRDTVDQGLRARAAEVSNLVQSRAARGGRAPRVQTGSFFERDEGFAAILTPAGALVERSSDLVGRSVLSSDDLRRARQGPLIGDRRVSGIEGDVRLLATPIESSNRRLIVVVASSLDDRQDAARNLLRLLVIGGLVALLLASLAGYAAITAALRPVESMRRRAREITAADGHGGRLPLAPAEDELRRLGETLNEMLASLEAAIERERAFVDDASHELRTPLALHKTELELALRYATSPVEMRAALASSIEEVDRLIGLAEDMLVVARSERVETHVESLEINRLLENMSERFRARAASAGRDLTIEGPPSGAVAGARLDVERALTNLIDNALRHGDGPIVLSAREHDAQVELHVRDRGGGFPPEFLDRAFSRFTRADPARPRGGTGLGLAIVAELARINHGSAGVANAETGGADAWIALPRAR